MVAGALFMVPIAQAPKGKSRRWNSDEFGLRLCPFLRGFFRDHHLGLEPLAVIDCFDQALAHLVEVDVIDAARLTPLACLPSGR